MRVLLYGAKVAEIRSEFDAFPDMTIVTSSPDVVVCYGGDGTLLSAERDWPSVPKVPIRNSLRGNRCLAHPAPDVIRRLAGNLLIPTHYMKLECHVRRPDRPEAWPFLAAMNEFNVHMARINSAVRFRIWFDDELYEDGKEILGDGFVVSTPFGSSAYFNHITRGFFYSGVGIAFKSTDEHTNHVVVSEDVVVRILITRGPAVIGFDNSTQYTDLYEGDELVIQRHPHPAVICTWGHMKRTSDAF